MKTVNLRSLKIQHSSKHSSVQIPFKNAPFHRNQCDIGLRHQSREFNYQNCHGSVSEKKTQSPKFPLQNDRIQRYCLSRFKQIQNLTRNEVSLPRNESLKKHKKDFVIKQKCGSARQRQNEKDTPQDKEDQRSLQRSAELGKTSILRQRLEMIKKYRTQQKENVQQNELQIVHDLSKIENSPIVVPKFVWSERHLGEGLRKCPQKIKILVKDPFERLIKQEHNMRQFELQLERDEEIEEIPYIEQSFVSSVYRKQLEEIILFI